MKEPFAQNDNKTSSKAQIQESKNIQNIQFKNELSIFTSWYFIAAI